MAVDWRQYLRFVGLNGKVTDHGGVAAQVLIIARRLARLLPSPLLTPVTILLMNSVVR